MPLHTQNLSNCCICMIGQFFQYLIFGRFLILGPTLHAPIQWKRAGLKTGTATGESSNKNAPTPRPASPHFVTECKNREMMRRTKYVVVECIFCSSNKVERALGRTDISESSFMIYLVPDSVPRLGHTGPAESEGQLPLPPHILLELKSQNCSIKRHCNYLPLHIFRSVLASCSYTLYF